MSHDLSFSRFAPLATALFFSSFVALTLGSIAACSSGSSTFGPTAGNDGGTEAGNATKAEDSGDAGELDLAEPAPGQIALQVTRTIVTKKRSGNAGPWSTTFVILEVTLVNGEGGGEAPLNPALFSVESDSGLSEVSSGGDNRYLQTPTCSATTSVIGGAKKTCALQVSLDGDVAPVRLRYRTPGALAELNGVASPTADKRSAVVSIKKAAPCEPCDNECTDLSSDIKNCGKCLRSVEQMRVYDKQGSRNIDGICENGTPSCGESGLTYCVSSAFGNGGSNSKAAACVDSETAKAIGGCDK